MKYILERLGEASTWRGVIALGTGFGVMLSPEMIEAIVATGMSMAGLIGMAFKDKKDKVDDKKETK